MSNRFSHVCVCVRVWVSVCVGVCVCPHVRVRVCVRNIKVSSNCPKGDIQAEYMLIDKKSDHEADKQVCLYVVSLVYV